MKTKVKLLLGNITFFQEPPTKAIVHELYGILLCENKQEAYAIGDMLCNSFSAYLIPSDYHYPIEYECTTIINAGDNNFIELNLIAIANHLANVREWCDIPEETHAGINTAIDQLNEIIEDTNKPYIKLRHI